MRKSPLTIQEHRSVAKQVHSIERSLHEMFEIINGRVPMKILDQLLTFRGVEKAIMKFKSDIEDEMFRHHTNSADCSTEVYYPAKQADRPSPRATRSI